MAHFEVFESSSPEAAREALEVRLRAGDVVLIGSVPDLLSDQDFADLLGVGLPRAQQILDSETLPLRWVGFHRRVDRDVALAYRRVRDADRRKTLDAMYAEEQGYPRP